MMCCQAHSQALFIHYIGWRKHERTDYPREDGKPEHQGDIAKEEDPFCRVCGGTCMDVETHFVSVIHLEGRDMFGKVDGQPQTFQYKD